MIEIPTHLINDYSLDGKIKIVNWWFENTGLRNRIYSKEAIDININMVKKGEYIKSSYQNTDPFLYEALKKYSINDLKTLIIGSEQPSYESICLAFGGKPFVVDYNYIDIRHEDIKFLNIEKFKRMNDLYDCVFSISSYEHDGLGRYGDPLNPWGDIESMKFLKNKIKKNGLLFLAIPIGIDTLFWNAGRWYGNIRFPLLIKEWELIDSYGFDNKMFFEEYEPGKKYNQPVFVLKNI